MVWDAAMAVHSLEYLKAKPGATVVILTGVGHAQKGAVPRQIRQRSQAPVAVLLPGSSRQHGSQNRRRAGRGLPLLDVK